MTRLILAILILIVLLVLGGGAYLAMTDIPAPSSPVERVLPDDRFPR